MLIYKSSPTNLKKITRHVYVRLDWGSKSLSSFLEVIKLINNHSVVTGPPHTPFLIPLLSPPPDSMSFIFRVRVLSSVWAESCVSFSLPGLEETVSDVLNSALVSLLVLMRLVTMEEGRVVLTAPRGFSAQFKCPGRLWVFLLSDQRDDPSSRHLSMTI